MNNNYQPVNNVKHGQTKLKSINTFQHVASVNNVLILMQEFVKAANEMPIIFIKNPESGVFQSVAVTGLELNENLFVKNDVWQGAYIPGSVNLYPFALKKLPSENQEKVSRLGFFIDEESTRVNDSEGIALFDNDGKETKTLAGYRVGITQYHKDQLATDEFVDFLVDQELLTECAYSYQNSGLNAQITDIYIIDINKINALTSEKYLELRQKGYLEYIYAQLLSFHQFDILAKRKQS
ncbi:MAG: SapC family protein [Colwellia sp.]|nr:SapC family protein [Colwellia sp.]